MTPSAPATHPADRLDDELWLWLDGERIRLVAAAPGRDALSLTAQEARRVAHRLLRLVQGAAVDDRGCRRCAADGAAQRGAS